MMDGANETEAYQRLKKRSAYFAVAIIFAGLILLYECLLHREYSFTIATLSLLLIISGTAFLLLFIKDKPQQTSTTKDLQAREIRISEKRFGFMVEHAVDIISLLDDKNNLLYINSAIEKITGYTTEEIRHVRGARLIHPDDLENSEKMYEELYANPGTIVHRTVRLMHKNGNVVWTEGIMVNLLHNKNVQAVISNFRDVTERKVAEQKIHESEKKFRNTLDKMMEGVQIIDHNWRYIYVNESVVKHGRYSEAEMVGFTMMEKYPGIEHSEMFKALQKCMQERIPAFMENEFIYPDNTKGWFELSIQPVPEGIFILSVDISDRKINEQAIKKLHDELEQKVLQRTSQLEMANKELEAFSYSVSHDLRAPLRAINGYARMLEEDYAGTLDQEGKRLLNTVKYNAQKMGSLIDDLLDFSRLGRKELQKTMVNMQDLAENVLTEIKKSHVHRAQIEVRRLHALNADHTLISQVLHNLIANAIKYSSKKEQPQIEIFSEEKTGEIIFCIRDNGAGFDMQYVDKLFGVFQRLHTPDEFDGTGVGLAIVHRIIAKHGGKVWGEGRLNEGAAFYFSVPLN